MSHRSPACVIGTVFLLIATLVHAAQQPTRIARVAWLCSQFPPSGFQYFVSSLQNRGYREGTNVHFEQRYAGGNRARLERYAFELSELNVNVIVACDGAAIAPARKATSTIPIVMLFGGDPIAAGYASSLAQPGGNVTGLTVLPEELAGKRIELLREFVPSLTRLAVLGPPSIVSQRIKDAADKWGIELLAFDVRGYEDLADAFRLATLRKANGLLVMPSPFTNPRAGQIVALANKARLPAIYPADFYAKRGGLMSYGPNLSEMPRRGAIYVDQILRGAKPADLPIQQPSTFDLVINATTAKSLGISIPSSLAVQAHSIIDSAQAQ